MDNSLDPYDYEAFQNEPIGGEEPGPKKKKSTPAQIVSDYGNWQTKLLGAKAALSNQTGLATQAGYVPSLNTPSPTLSNDYSLAQKEVARLKPDMDLVVNAYSDQLFGKSGENIGRYKMTKDSGVTEIDPVKIKAEAESINTRLGGNAHTFAALYNGMLERGSQKLLQPEVNKEFVKAKRESGAEFIGPAEVKKGVTSIVEKFSLKNKSELDVLGTELADKTALLNAGFDKYKKPIDEKYSGIIEKEQARILAEIGPQIEESFSAYKSQLDQQLRNREITHRSYNEDLENYGKGLIENADRQAIKGAQDYFAINYENEYNEELAPLLKKHSEGMRAARIEFKEKEKNVREKNSYQFKSEWIAFLDSVNVKNKEVAEKQREILQKSYDKVIEDRQTKDGALFNAFEVAGMLPGGNFKVFGRTFAGALRTAQEDVGWMMNSLGIDNSLVRKMIASGAKGQLENELQMPELTWENALNPTRVQGLVGQGAGYMALPIASTIATGSPFAGAFVGTLQNSFINAGETYKQVLQKGGTLEEAQVARNKQIAVQVALLPLDLTVSKTFLPAVGGKLKTVAEGAISETAGEYIENVSQDAFVNSDKSISDVLGNNGSINAAFDAGLSTIFLGAGSAMQQGKVERKIKQLVPGVGSQWIADLVSRGGVDRANLIVETMYANGDLNKEQLDKYKYVTQSISGKLQDAKTIGLTSAQTKAYVGLSSDLEMAKERAESVSDPALKAAAEKVVAEKQKQVEAVVSGKEDLAEVRLPGNMTVAMPVADAGKLMSEAGIKEGIVEGEVGITTTDAKLNEEITALHQAEAEKKALAAKELPDEMQTAEVTDQEFEAIREINRELPNIKGSYGVLLHTMVEDPSNHRDLFDTVAMAIEDDENQARTIFGDKVVNKVLSAVNEERSPEIVTPEADLSSRPPFEKFVADMIGFAETNTDSSFDFVLTLPMDQKTRQQAIRNIREGKETKASQQFMSELQKMYDAGEVVMNRSRGNNASTVGVPISDFYNQASLTSQEQSFADNSLDDSLVDIITSEGITLDNIDSLKNLFDGFPYTAEDFTTIKEYLQQQAKGIAGSQENSFESQSSEEDPFPNNQPGQVIIDARGNRKFNADGSVNPKFEKRRFESVTVTDEAGLEKKNARDAEAERAKVVEARKEFLSRVSDSKNPTSDFNVYAKLPKDKKRAKLDAISKKIDKAKTDGVISEEDHEKLSSRIEADYAELGSDPAPAGVKASQAAASAAKADQQSDEDAVADKSKRQTVADKIRKAAKKTKDGLAKLGIGAPGVEAGLRSIYSNTDDAFEAIRNELADDPIAQRAIQIVEAIVKRAGIVVDPNSELEATDMELGLYDRQTKRLQLNFPRLAGDTKLLARIALHEFMHAATAYEIDNSQALADELTDILSEVREALGVSSVQAFVDLMVSQGIIEDGKYGATNIHEMVAELFTNQEFYNYLKGIAYKGDSFIKKIFNAIANFFSKAYQKLTNAKSDIKADNMADYLTNLVENYFDENTRTGESKGEVLAAKKSPLGILGMTSDQRSSLLTTIADMIEEGATIKDTIAGAVEFAKANTDFTNTKEIETAIRAELQALGILAQPTSRTQAKKNIDQQNPKSTAASATDSGIREKPGQKAKEEVSLEELWRRRVRSEKQGVKDYLASPEVYAKKLREQIRKAIKAEARNANAEMANAIKAFARINPQYVENIDEYIEMGQRVLGAARGAKAKVTEGFGFVENADLGIANHEINEYVEKFEALAEEKKKQRIADALNAAIGDGQIDPAAYTLDDLQAMRDALAENTEADPTLSAAQAEEKRQALIKVTEYNRMGLKEWRAEQADTLSELQSRTADSIETLDLNRLDAKQLVYVNDVINNIVVNGSFANAGDAMVLSEVQSRLDQVNAKVQESGVNLGSLKNLFASDYTNTALQNEFVYKNSKLAADVQRISGSSGIFDGHARARKRHDEVADGLVKLKKTLKPDIDSASNRIARGIYAAVLRNFGGTTEEVKAEFDRMKSLIKQSYEALLESDREEEKREGRVIQAEYDRLLADSESVNDVRQKMDFDNIQVVNYFVQAFEKNIAEVEENAAVFNNEVFETNENYTARKYKAVNGEIDDVQKDVFAEVYSSKKIDNKMSSTKMKARRNTRLKKGLVLNLDFDSVQDRAHFETMYDIETNESIAIARGFLNSQESISAMGGTKNRAELQDNLRTSVLLQKEKTPSLSKSEQMANKVLGTIQAKGIRIALGSVFQALNQYPSVAMKTLVNLGGDMGLYAKAFMIGNNIQLFDQFAIGLRGHSKAGFNTKGEIGESNDANFGNNVDKAIAWVGEKSQKVSDAIMATLVGTDVAVAKTSWLAYYMQDLKLQGTDLSGIDWENEHQNPNQEAAAYAEQMVSRTQGANDPTSTAKVYKDARGFKKILFNQVLPFNSFGMNMRMAFFNDWQKMVYGGAKAEAARNLVGTAVESAIYNTMKVYVLGKMTTYGAQWVAQAFGMWDDDDDDQFEDSQKIKIGSLETSVAAKKTVAGSLSDFLVGGMGGATQSVFATGANAIWDMAVNESYYKNGTWTERDVATLFTKYDPAKYGKTDFGYLGSYGVLPARAVDLYNQKDIVFTKKTKKFKGGISKDFEMVPVTQQQYNAHVASFIIDAAAIIGLSDAQLSATNQKFKNIVDRKMQEQYGGRKMEIIKGAKKPEKSKKNPLMKGLELDAIKKLNKLKNL